MIIAENYSSVRTLDVPEGRASLPIGTLPAAGTYTISFTYVVHSGRVQYSFLLYGGANVARISPSSDGRISFTFVLDTANVGQILNLYSDNQYVTAANNHVTFDNLQIVSGTQESDVWTPAHADLTAEQIATLPPYGEYKEIKSF